MRRHLSSLTLLLLTLLLPAITASASPDPKGIEEKPLDKVPQLSERLPGYDTTAEVTERMAAMPLHSIEGLWRFAAEGTLMAIERIDDDTPSADDAGTVTYRMVVVSAADLSLRPGTVMGYLSPTAKRGVYDARLYTGRTDPGTALHSPKSYTVTLTDSDTRLSLNRYGTSYRFNWWRLLPYMYSRLVSRTEKKPSGTEGCLRVYPAPAIPLEPRYL